MKKDKKILLAITGISLLLGGCGTSQSKQKSDNNKNVKTENVKSTTQSAMTSKADSMTTSNDVAFGQKISNDEFYVMAYAKNEHITLDKLLNGSKTWVFPSVSIYDPNYAFYKENNYNCIGDSSNSNEGSTHLINIDNNNVMIAHLESTAPKQDHAEFTYQNLTFNKQDLIKQFLTSKDQVNKLAQITQNMRNNETQATKDITKKNTGSSSSSQNNGNVDTKKLTAQQVDNWVYQAVKQNDYAGQNPPKDAFTFGHDLDDSDCVIIPVRLNDDNSWVKSQLDGAQPDRPNAYVAMYRIDSQGNLQENTAIIGNGDWKDTNIPYPGN